MSVFSSFPLVGMALPNEGASLSSQQAAVPVSSPWSTWNIAKDMVAGASAAMGSPEMAAGRFSAAVGKKGLFSVESFFGARGVTMILGLLLIAAGLFSHPAVRERIVSAGKTAGKAAALAA